MNKLATLSLLTGGLIGLIHACTGGSAAPTITSFLLTSSALTSQALIRFTLVATDDNEVT